MNKINGDIETIVGTHFSFDLNGVQAKNIIGLQIQLPAGKEELAEQITSNPFAIELGKLLCMAMGNPEGCIPVQVMVNKEHK